jgi:fructokinase
MPDVRIGIDFGGVKIEVTALAPDDSAMLRCRVPTPTDYDEAVRAVRDLVAAAETSIETRASIGIGRPGRLDPVTGCVHNANCLDGRPVRQDLRAALGREVRIANDAICFAQSEATDGAAGGRGPVVFGATLGAGCGGGLVVSGVPMPGHNGIAGEWGHNPFPWPADEPAPGRRCWCGQLDCIETVVSGRALAIDCDGPCAEDAASVAARAGSGDPHRPSPRSTGMCTGWHAPSPVW